MAVNKNRNLQFLRNSAPVPVLSHNAAVTEAQTKFNSLPMEDGEIALFRYQIGTNVDGIIVVAADAPIHTIVGVAHVAGDVKNIEIIANYDHLTNIINGLDATLRVTSDGNVSVNADGELTVSGNTGAYVAIEVVEEDGKLIGIKVKENIDETIATRISEAINALNGTATIATINDNNVVTLKAGIVETNGIVSNNTDTDIVLAKVAKTGAAVDVSVAQKLNGETEVLPAGTVQGTLEAIAAEIDAMDSTYTPGNLVKVNFTQVDGKVTTFTTDETALETRLQNIENNTITGKEAIVVTPDTTTGNNEVSLKIAEGEKVLSQSTAGLQTTLTVDTIKYGEDAGDKAGKTYIQIKGIGGAVISETDAAAFVKDGFLQSVTKDEVANTITFTWNTDAGIQATTISIKELCDVYTAKENDWILLDRYEFSHKLSTVIPTAEEGQEQATSKTVGNATATTVDSASETVTFKVPTITVDRAGHVTAASDSEITITLPSYIGTAVQTIKGETAELNNSDYVNVKAEKTANAEGAVEYTLTSKVKVGAFPTADTELAEGLATVQDVEDFVLNNSASVAAKATETTVEKSTTQPYVYTVGLADVAQTNNTTAKSSFDDENNTFTFIKAVHVDGKGRVTGVDTETVTENFDMGMYD